MIRRATPDDVLFIVGLGRQLHAESPHYRGRPFNVETVSVFVTWLLELHAGWLVTRDDVPIGYALAMASEDWISGEMVGTEVSIYVTPSFRGGMAFRSLALAMERWWISQGCVRWTVGASTGIEDARTVALYERMGYAPAGQVMQKRSAP